MLSDVSRLLDCSVVGLTNSQAVNLSPGPALRGLCAGHHMRTQCPRPAGSGEAGEEQRLARPGDVLGQAWFGHIMCTRQPGHTQWRAGQSGHAQ